MQHHYLPAKKSHRDSILVSKFDGEYFVIQCSCGKFGVGKSPTEAMDHLNELHEKKSGYASLLFVNEDMILSRLEQLTAEPGIGCCH